MSEVTPLFVGLDVHQDSIAVAYAQGQSADPPVYVGAIGTREADLSTLIRRLQSTATGGVSPAVADAAYCGASSSASRLSASLRLRVAGLRPGLRLRARG